MKAGRCSAMERARGSGVPPREMIMAWHMARVSEKPSLQVIDFYRKPGGGLV
jgi:hypothetical protein